MAESIKRKITAVFLVLAMVIGMIPAVTLTANAESVSYSTIVDFNTVGISWNSLPTSTDLGSSTFSDNGFTFKYDDGHNTYLWGASGSGAGSSDSPAITLNGGSDQVETLTITNSSGKSFKFSSFYLEGMGYSHGNWQIEGFRDGTSCGSQIVDTSFITKNVSLTSNANLQNVDKIVISSTSAGYNGVCLDDFVFDPAVTTPMLSAQSASEVTETGADINFTSDKEGTYYYLVYAAGDEAPDADTIKAQGVAVSKGSGAALAAANKVSVNSLSAATSYKAYVIVEDASNNKSAVSAIDIATEAAETYAISLVTVENFNFPVATAGYGAQSFYSVRVDSTGTGATGALTVKLSGKNPEAFALSTDSISSIASGENYSFKVNPVTGLSSGDYTATVTVSGDKVAPKSFNVSFTVNPAGTTYTATVRTYADGVAKDITGDVELYKNTSRITALKSDTGIYSATVASGEYWIYIGGRNTGRTLTIGTSDNSISMEYYTVSFSTTHSGTATGSTVSATCEGSTISSGALVLKGSRVTITAMGTGAGSYSYLWSGTGTSGQTTAQIASSSLSGAIDAACAVTGTEAPSADPDYEINGAGYTWTGSAETILLSGANDSLAILKAPLADVRIEVQSADSSEVEINGNSVACDKTRVVIFNNITLTVDNLNITAPLNWPALQLNSDGRAGTMILNVKGNCSFTGTGYACGVISGHDQDVVITGNGTLNATGGGNVSDSDGGAGILVNSYVGESSLTIEGNITINSTGGSSLTHSGGDGISVTPGDLLIKSGVVKATSGISYGSNYNSSAGIRASFPNNDHSIGGNVIIEGGEVTAIGGDADKVSGGYGIYAFNKLSIKGGSVTAIGGNSISGVGGAAALAYEQNLEVSGGSLNATGGSSVSNYGGQAIYNFYKDIVISGGTVTATGGNSTNKDGGRGIVVAGSGNLLINGGDVTAKGGNGGGYGAHAIYVNLGTATVDNGADLYAVGGNGATAGGGVGLRAAGYDGATLHGNTVAIANDAGNVYIRGGQGATVRRASIMGKDVYIGTGNIGSVVMEGSNLRSIKNTQNGDNIYLLTVFTDPAADVTISSAVTGSLAGSYTYHASAKAADGLAYLWLPSGSQTVDAAGYRSTAISLPDDDAANNSSTISKKSNDASLTGLLAKLDTTPGLQTGADSSDAIVWEVSVSNSISELSLTDIAVASGASIKLYSNPEFTAEVTDPDTLTLEVGSAIKAYIRVTSEDGLNTKYYAVAVTRAASGDANLTSVLGQTITAGAEAGTNLAPKTAAISVANTVTKVAAEDIVKSDAGATTTFYGTDSSFTTPAASSVNLTAGTGTDVYVKVAAADGTQLYYKITVNREYVSEDASLTSVLGQTITAGAEAGTKLAPKTAAISAANTVTKVAAEDIVKSDARATTTFYGTDSSFTTPAVSSVNLTAGTGTDVYVKVAAADGTQLYYKITVNREYVSEDANLTSVLGQTITAGAEAGTKLAPKTAAISVANTVTKVAEEDIVKSDAGATTTFYGTDSSFTTPAASSVNLTAGTGTDVYVKVAAADGTQLYYKITVNREYVSGDASLTSVLGQTITAGAEAGTKLVPKTAAISVANAVTKVAAEDIVKSDAGATTTFYGTDSTFTTPSAISVDLSAGSGTAVYIKATAADGTQFYYKITVNRASASSGGGQGESTKQPAQTQPSDTGVEILVNGKAETAAKATTAQVGAQMVTTIVVDDKKVEEKLQKEGNNATITIPVKKASDVVVGQLNGQTVKSMESKEAVLEIKTENVTYTLPAAQINIDAISAQLGHQIELSDIKVNVAISEPPQDTVKVIGDTANKNNYVVVAKPVEFNITCTSGNKTIEVTKFNSYVERLVAIPEGIDPSKITTGIVLNSDGTFSHVPTAITIIDGKYYARINSLTNSTYSVVYSPKAFKDVEKHWAKNAVNDMGSRLVISGVGNNMFEPDVDITRAEFAAIVVKALGLMRPGTGKASFNDISKNDWYYDAVSIAYEHGIISGYDDGNFGPNDKITREQAMTIIAKAARITGLNPDIKSSEVSDLLSKYADGNAASDYAKTSIATCLKTEIITGRSSTAIAPKNYITRAEVASIVQKLLKKSSLI